MPRVSSTPVYTQTTTIRTHEIDFTLPTEAEHDHHVLMMATSEGMLLDSKTPVFTTDADVWWPYLSGLSKTGAMRQYHNCNACRQFMKHYGGLVAIDPESGQIRPLFWSSHSGDTGYYGTAYQSARHAVLQAKVTGVFYTDAKVLGIPRDAWTHIHAYPTKGMRHSNRTQTPFQAMAEKAEDFRILKAALAKYSVSLVGRARELLASNNVYRSEKTIRHVEWLVDVYAGLIGKPGIQADNYLWHVVATAPAGFCHVSGGMTGALLDDMIEFGRFSNGKAEVIKRFEERMNPLKYMRPQAAPKAGNLAQANKIVTELQATKALDRRFAHLHELQAIWKPNLIRTTVPNSGPFSGLLRPEPERLSDNEVRNMTQGGRSPITMTWHKFQKAVLPFAKSIYLRVPARGAFGGFTTATYPSAPPILKWDNPALRNPASMYFWTNPSGASFGLTADTYAYVKAVVLHPSMWNGLSSDRPGATLVLAGARETRRPTLCLFPEQLRSEYHSIRSSIEAYSNANKLQGYEDEHAVGLEIAPHQKGTKQLLVVLEGGKGLYNIDRWE